jgi:hypothetical protein
MPENVAAFCWKYHSIVFDLLLFRNKTNLFCFQFREYTDDSHEPVTDMIINMYK